MTDPISTRVIGTATFERDGVLFPLPLLSREEAARTQARVADLMARTRQPHRMGNLHLYFPWMLRLASHPALLDAAETLLGPDLLIAGSVLLHKPARDPAFASWHQDNTYATFLLSAWIALTDSDEENGCMRVVRGTHRSGRLPHVVSTDAHNMLARGPQLAGPVDEGAAVPVLLKAGEFSLHHPAIVHGSGPNESADARTGFVVRFATATLAEAKNPVVRVRGGADCSHLPLLTAPPPDDLDEGIRAWERGSRSSPAIQA
jgi:ectoine hydroxylase-related dioxygenase (phytanoyl-CoA dioxygenase family)